MMGAVAEQIGGPRDHLANERTQLAWLRTGATVMVVGLAVARFADDGEVSAASMVAGGILILTGAAGVCFGTLRYRRVARDLREGVPTAAETTAGPTLAAGVLLVAVIVAAVVVLVGT
jgi:putative membrane protein